MCDNHTTGDYRVCRAINRVTSGQLDGGGTHDSASDRSSCCNDGGRNTNRCSKTEKPLWLWSDIQRKGRRTLRRDATAGRHCLEHQRPLLRQMSTQHRQRAHQLRQRSEMQTRLQREQNQHVSATQQQRMNSLLSWENRLSQQQRYSRQRPHRRLKVKDEDQQEACQQHQSKMQEGQLQRREAQNQTERPEDDDEDEEEHGKEGKEEVEQGAAAGLTLLNGVRGTARQLYLHEQPFLSDGSRVQGNTLSWPLHRQHELATVQLTGRCFFQEVAAHGQERCGPDARAPHCRQRQSHPLLAATGHSLPSLESANSGPRATRVEAAVAATGGRGEEGKAVAHEEEEAGDGQPRPSFSLVLRPNVWARRSRQASGTEGGGSLVLGSLMRSDSITHEAGAQPGLTAERKQHASAAMNDVERAVGGDAVSACSAGGSLRSFGATHADADSRHKGSFLSACCFWSKRTFFSRTRWHYLIFLCIYSYLIGPIYLNWAPLRELLFRSGAYLWECDPEERDPNSLRYIAAADGGESGGPGERSGSGRGGRPATCTLQRLRVGNLYTVCAAADFGFSFFGGLVVDWLGPKTGSLLGSASMLGGWLLLAVSGESVPVYVPGMVLFGVGIDMAFYGTMSVARLFPGHANTVIAALAGMRGLGLMSPLILNALPLPFTAVMLGYALLGLLPAVLIASVYAPWKPFHGDWLKEKRRRQQRESTLHATSGGSSSSSLAFDAAAPTNQHVPVESPKVAAQETAADLLRTTGMTEQQPYSQARRKLLHEEEAESSNHLKWQQRRQKGRQQKGIEREPKQEQQPPVNLSAGSAKRIARCKTQQSRGFLGPAAEEKQQLLHPEAAESGEGRKTHLNNIFGDDVEEGWLSDTGVSGKRRSRLLSPHQHLRQEILRKDLTAEQKTERDQQYQSGSVAELGGSCEEDQARCSYTTSSTGSKGESGMVPPLSISRVQRPGELLDGASSSSVASAMLQQQQQPQRAAAMSTATQHPVQQVQPEGRTLSGMFDGKGEGQQGQAAALCEDSEGSNKDKRILSFIGGSRRTLSTAEDEESTELYGTGGVPQRVKRSSVDRVEPENLGASRAGRSDTALGELYQARGGEPVAAASPAGAAATSDMRGNSLPEAGWNVELATMLSPTDESTARAPAESGTQDQPNEAHAAVVLGDKQIPLHRSLSSRQFPRTCAGRMRYLLAYVWQHPWTVQSRAFLRDYLFTLTYLPVVPYFALSLMRSVYFSDASEDLVPAALGALHVLLAFVCFIPSLAGLLADMWTMMPCLVLVNTIGTLVILGSLCAHLTNIVAFEYVAVILYMPFAALLTNQVYFYVADTFPEKHLGKLCGFACSIGGVVSLSVTPMFEFSVKTDGGFTIMLCVMLAISGVCYGLLVVLYVAQKREKKRRAEAAAAAAAALDVVATASVEAPPKGAPADANVYASTTAAPQPQQQQPAPAAVL